MGVFHSSVEDHMLYIWKVPDFLPKRISHIKAREGPSVALLVVGVGWGSTEGPTLKG